MAFELYVPLEPQTASRPNWTAKGLANRTYMPARYQKWRERFDAWWADYYEKTDGKLLYYLTHLSNGEWIREDLPLEKGMPEVDEDGLPTHNWGLPSTDFFGYKVKLLFVLERTAHELRPLPLATRTADIDNYSKAILDGIFQSKEAKHYAVDDRWIQDLHAIKRYTVYGSDEAPHIEVTIERLERK